MSNNNDDNEPFNDAIDHQHNIEGDPTPSGGSMPLPIRVIGYFLIGGIVVMLFTGLLGNLLFN
ncbi:hypothetical protein [Salimicrobium flavidum]|uniref:Amino acid transporter n=1 Tax=Salimicrobium flavidum TaxID=570947 RepID=A0A1N7KPN0_9BACI|nr:hypothetical protein [Salimicrobium flavidum]SIS63514.1 hypothetical protein SAMN05421687_11525 [Salimicrobium flavidum]